MPRIYASLLPRCLRPASCLLGFAGLVACENSAPADQLTVVQGAVTSAETGRPLPGVLLAIESYARSINGSTTDTRLTGDSVRTDARGSYHLGFRNSRGRYYAISFDPQIPGQPHRSRYALYSVYPKYTAPSLGPDEQELTIGQTNTADFAPDVLNLVAVRIRNRSTRYRWLAFGNRYLNGTRLDTLAYYYTYYPSQPATQLAFKYFNYNLAVPYAQVLNDTTVALRVQNPAARYPDTLRATLTFVR